VNVIPDSSFFICFIDDLEDYLPNTDRIHILTTIASNFTVLVVPAVETESRLKRLPSPVMDQIQLATISIIQSEPLIELLRPLLGKGEYQVISYAHEHLLKGDHTFLVILDDGLARSLVRRSLPKLADHMKGTVGFLGLCVIRKILDKDETIHLITIIGKSNFRVDQATIAA